MEHVVQAVDPFVFRLSIFVLAVFVVLCDARDDLAGARAERRPALGGVERAGGDDGAGGHQLTAGRGRQKGLQVGGAESVDDAQNPALVVEETPGGIAE